MFCVSTILPGALFVKRAQVGEPDIRWAEGSPEEVKDVQNPMVSWDRRASVCRGMLEGAVYVIGEVARTYSVEWCKGVACIWTAAIGAS